jgi:hypothetical protein
MLTTYVDQVQRLLHNVTGTLYVESDLVAYVNDARKQVAQEGQCIRALASTTLSSGTNNFPLSLLTFNPSTGIQTAIETRSILANGKWVQPRNWEWFTLYCLGNSDQSATLSTWSQFGDGVNALVYVWPVPNVNQSLTMDVACFPIDLGSNADVEAIPFPWQRAVKYWAAYLAFLGVMRNADAENMKNEYEKMMVSARMQTRATVLPGNFNADWAVGGGERGSPQ